MDEVYSLRSSGICATCEAFIACVLLASWWSPEPPFMQQQLDLLDVFAGKARIGKAGELLGYQCRAMDILYDVGKFSRRGKKSMDLLEPAGFLFLTLAVQKRFF